MIKKIISLSFSLILFWSCNVDEINDNISLEPIAINSADVPQEFKFGETYNIEYSYFLPTTCHSFNDLFITGEGVSRNIAVISSRRNGVGCEELTGELRERSFNFTINDISKATYTLNFFQGLDDNGESLFLTFEVPVVQ